MSDFFTRFRKALSDPQAYSSFQNEMSTEAIIELKQNSLRGKTAFKAVVLPSDLSTTNTVSNSKAIRVRPLDIHDFIIPEPCVYKDPSLIQKIISLHPVAFSKNIGGPQASQMEFTNPIIYGQIVTCTFGDGPQHGSGRLRALTYDPETATYALGNRGMNLSCINPNLNQNLQNAFSKGGYKPYGDPERKQYSGIKGEQVVFNGKIPKDLLGTTKQTLTPFKVLIDAAPDLDNLSVAFEKEFGIKLAGSGYRTYDSQVRVYSDPKKIFVKENGAIGHLGAKPGTSEHGWGLAIDINTDIIGSNLKSGFMSNPRYKWLFENAPRYNWHHPLWAQEPDGWPEVKRANSKVSKKGTKPESWHWEWTKKSTVLK